jgi:hypothetical protein
MVTESCNLNIPCSHEGSLSPQAQKRLPPTHTDISILGLYGPGYRDVALYVRLRCLGPRSHVCELQLQLASFTRIKSESGHQRYVAWRNAMGF